MNLYDTTTVNDLKDRPEEFLNSNFSHILKGKLIKFSNNSQGLILISFGEITIADPENPTTEEQAAISALVQPVYDHLFKLFSTGGLFLQVGAASTITIEPASFGITDGVVSLNNESFNEFYADGHFFYGINSK